MAFKRTNSEAPGQLDPFDAKGNAHDHTDAIRPDGREALARVPAENGEGTRSEGDSPGDVVRGPGQNGGRDGRDSPKADSAGADSTTGPRPSVGNGAREVHPAPARGRRDRVEPPRNVNNYRITEADRLGDGSLKQKFPQ